MTSRLLPEVILENREALHHLSVACHQRRHLRLRETFGFSVASTARLYPPIKENN